MSFAPPLQPQPYAELHCVSNFSFQRGASHAHELVQRAHALGYSALAVTDECSLAGVVRAHAALQELKAQEPDAALQLIIGAEFCVDVTPADAPTWGCAFKLIALATHRQSYGHLSEFITQLRRAGDKNHYELGAHALNANTLADCLLLIAPERSASPAQVAQLAQAVVQAWRGRAWLAATLLLQLDDAAWLASLQQAATASALPVVAAGNVHMHVRSRKPLQDVLTAIGLHCPVYRCGTALQPNAERHLRSRLRLGQIYPPELLAQTLVVASRCNFCLSELRYEYPREVVPPGVVAADYLAHITWRGASERYPAGIAASVQAQVMHELQIIAELHFEHYFLTVYDIVRFARSQGILCQGRGSAANSAVCYCLGITEVDPTRATVLFERFISKERNEPPDIDVDFEHQRREEVIQYLYQKYGRDRAALTATVASYRAKSAIRDVGKALGFEEHAIATLSKDHHHFDSLHLEHNPQLFEKASLDPAALLVQQWVQLTQQLLGFPRHLGQHTGGFVLSEGALSRMVPIENASMPQRSVIQWDKDDLDSLGLLKVDVLALGMLSAIRRSLEHISWLKGETWRMQDIPSECPATYDMICAADTVGVFQIESRAQMSMLPRLRPRCFYDLVIEVAIVRPGPIQGGMVHPYLRRRQGLEPVSFPDDRQRSGALRHALGRTLGVPLFQEQVMQVAILAAGFSPGQADQLRRAMAAWKRKGGVHHFHDRVVNGMTERGYELEFAQNIFKQIQGFGEYGFPESHAASFALLVYVSCWIKHHHPAVFLCALLNAQPMGFYSPSALVQDAQRHGVNVLAVCVNHSQAECSLLDATTVRLGLNLVLNLKKSAVSQLIKRRGSYIFDSTEDLARRTGLTRADLDTLAAADALASLSGHRRQQAWDAAAWLGSQAPPHEAGAQGDWLNGDATPDPDEDHVQLRPAPEGQDILQDYASTGLTLRRHPMALLRAQLNAKKLQPAAQLHQSRNNQLVKTCGIVTMRQQPSTAKGTTFVTLEDETGTTNVIVWKRLRLRQRDTLVHARLMAVYGQWQLDATTGGQVKHLIAHHLLDLTPMLGGLSTESRDFR